jgi:hypothetical protein
MAGIDRVDRSGAFYRFHAAFAQDLVLENSACGSRHFKNGAVRAGGTTMEIDERETSETREVPGSGFCQNRAIEHRGAWEEHGTGVWHLNFSFRRCGCSAWRGGSAFFRYLFIGSGRYAG